MSDPISDFEIPEELPALPLRELVVFPYMVLPIFVARERSIAAIEDAGLTFVGPSSQVARRAGAKDEAKKLARKLGASVTPGVDNISARALLRQVNDRQGLISCAERHEIPFGYVDNIHELMKAADIVITKPGGVTTAEVLAQNLPMIIIKPIPGQEMHNATYLTNKQTAIRVDTPSAMHLIIDDLLENPEKCDRMRDAARHLSKPESCFDIARLLLGMPND